MLSRLSRLLRSSARLRWVVDMVCSFLSTIRRLGGYPTLLKHDHPAALGRSGHATPVGGGGFDLAGAIGEHGLAGSGGAGVGDRAEPGDDDGAVRLHPLQRP